MGLGGIDAKIHHYVDTKIWVFKPFMESNWVL